MTNFLIKSKLLRIAQYRFRKYHSVTHALLDAVTYSYDAIDHKKHTELLFMNLKKAFDTASHKILLSKLYHYGIRGHAFALIKNYLSFKQQFESINNIFSSLKPISIGVPQVSILGSSLFSIYMNDMPVALNISPTFFR